MYDDNYRYSKDTVIHYNQTYGLIHVYRIVGEKVERHFQTLTVDVASEFVIQACENLLLITNLRTNLLSIYDSKSNKLREPLCIPVLLVGRSERTNRYAVRGLIRV
jgi:hypothetical protein